MATKQSTGFVKLKENIAKNSPDISGMGNRGLRDKIKAARAKKDAVSGKTGPTSRGGKRTPADVTERKAFKAEINRQSQKDVAKPKAAPAKSEAKPAAKAKPSMTSGSMKRSAIPKAEMSSGAQDVKNDIKAPVAPAAKSAKKDIKLGVVGRTGGKWHLGKKAGKG